MEEVMCQEKCWNVQLKKRGHNGGRLTCVCSLTQQCTLFCSIPVSYVRCFVLRDVLGLCGSVPGVAAVCASFLAVELTFSSWHSRTTWCSIEFPRAMTFTYECPVERVVRYRLVLCCVVQCQVPGAVLSLWPVFLFDLSDYRWGVSFSPTWALLYFAVLQPLCCILQLTNFIVLQTLQLHIRTHVERGQTHSRIASVRRRLRETSVR